MGADLNNIVKCQALSDEHVQFLVYQLLRGLKVGARRGPAGGGAGAAPDSRRPPLAVHPLGRDRSPGRCLGVRVGLPQDPSRTPALTARRPAGPEAQQRGRERGLRAQGEPWTGRGGGAGLPQVLTTQGLALDPGLRASSPGRRGDDRLRGHALVPRT